MLLRRGLLRLQGRPETRACAAVALGQDPHAGGSRELLQKVADDKDLVVRQGGEPRAPGASRQ